MTTKFFSTLLIIGAGLTITSCTGGGSKQNESTEAGIIQGEVKIDGSSTVYPISEAISEEFRKKFPDVKVTVGLSGTGGGFKKFGRAEIDVNDASRPIKPSEDSACKANNISYQEVLVAFDGLAVVVNPKNDWAKDITVAELKKLWEPEAQKKITKWSQVRTGWPDEEIRLYGAGVESGTYDYFTEVIVGKSHSSRGDYTASEDDNVLVQGISTDKYALGFFGLAYFEENADKLKLLPVDDGKDDNGKGPVAPSIETVKNKTYVPLGRPLFIYINDKGAQRKEIQEFVKFYIENARTLSKEVGYVPLSDEETNSEMEKFNNFINKK